jgi:hypothetical protein
MSGSSFHVGFTSGSVVVVVIVDCRRTRTPTIAKSSTAATDATPTRIVGHDVGDECGSSACRPFICLGFTPLLVIFLVIFFLVAPPLFLAGAMSGGGEGGRGYCMSFVLGGLIILRAMFI